MKRELTLETEKLKSKCTQVEGDMATVKDANRELELSTLVLGEKIGNLQSALDQSECQLAECEKMLQVQ